MNRSNPTEKIYIFPTHLGWTCLHWKDDLLCRVAFGYGDSRSLKQAISVKTSARRTSLSHRQKRLVDRVLAFTDGAPESFQEVAILLESQTEFQREVLSACRRIPYGETRSYAQLAKSAGRPKAARAVGSTMAKNPLPLIIPCHRVVASGSGMGGFSAPGGLTTKRKLLALEQNALVP